MTEESDTQIITKRPVLKAVLDVVLKRLETSIALAITASSVAIYQHASNHKQIWSETGQHFQDLVQQVRHLQSEVDNLKTNK